MRTLLQHCWLISASIVAPAAAAFHAIRMIFDSALDPTVIATHVKHNLFLNWMRINQGVHLGIVFLQSVGRQHGFPAQRTAHSVLLKAVEHAAHMHGMPARQHVCGFGGMEQIFQAHGAVRVEPIRLARVIPRDNARAAFVTMHTIIITLYATNAALVAVVIISLNAIIKKVAHRTKIGSKLNATCIIAACLGHGLSFIALIAHHFFDGVPIHFMRLGVIVTVTAYICFSATWGHQAALAHIVLAT